MRPPIPTWFFALVVVRLGRRFLLVQERDFDQPWYFPAGRIEPGEPIAAAALRETLEEAGIPVVLEGLARVEQRIHKDGSARIRFIFVARPADDTPLKSAPDEETLQARWFTLEEMDALNLRSPIVLEICKAISAGATIAPLSVLTLGDE